jgi:hypothetical protein
MSLLAACDTFTTVDAFRFVQSLRRSLHLNDACFDAVASAACASLPPQSSGSIGATAARPLHAGGCF